MGDSSSRICGWVALKAGDIQVKIFCRYYREETLGIFELEGEKVLADVKTTWDIIRQAIANDQLQSVLIRDRAKDCLRSHELIALEQWLVQSHFPRQVKVAIIDSGLTNLSQNSFFETVLRNRGWWLISVFPNEQGARRWLGFDRIP
jgi:hypothetical protein